MKLTLELNPIKWFKKEEELEYPPEFAIVDFSPTALEKNLKDNYNKIIKIYSFDFHGDRTVKIYPYSLEMVKTLEEVRKIPVFDRTTYFKDEKFPVYARIQPMEARYVLK